MIPTPAEESRLVQALIAKATRILMLVEAPLGSWGELTELGVATVKPDYQIRELLKGFHYSGVDVEDLEVTTDMVIRQGLGIEPAAFPAARVPDVARAIDTARSWVATTLGGFGVG